MVNRGRTPRNSATSAYQLHGAVHGDRGGAAAPFGAEEHVGDARLLRGADGGFAARGGAPDRPLKRLLHGARGGGVEVGGPGEELVRAGAHRLEDPFRVRGVGDREDRQGRGAGAQPLDGGHPRRGVEADVHHRDVRVGHRAAALFHDADGDSAGPQQRRGLPAEFVVCRDDQCCQLCHGFAALRSRVANDSLAYIRAIPRSGRRTEMRSAVRRCRCCHYCRRSA
jgi:hypothetical protein